MRKFPILPAQPLYEVGEIIEISTNYPKLHKWCEKNAKKIYSYDVSEYGFGVIDTYEMPYPKTCSDNKTFLKLLTEAGYVPCLLKYTHGDLVVFKDFVRGEVMGAVDIVDKYGTMDNDNREPSYDILVKDYVLDPKRGPEDVLVKHISESDVLRKVGEVAADTAGKSSEWEMRMFPVEDK